MSVLEHQLELEREKAVPPLNQEQRAKTPDHRKWNVSKLHSSPKKRDVELEELKKEMELEKEMRQKEDFKEVCVF